MIYIVIVLAWATFVGWGLFVLYRRECLRLTLALHHRGDELRDARRALEAATIVPPGHIAVPAPNSRWFRHGENGGEFEVRRVILHIGVDGERECDDDVSPADWQRAFATGKITALLPEKPNV